MEFPFVIIISNYQAEQLIGSGRLLLLFLVAGRTSPLFQFRRLKLENGKQENWKKDSDCRSVVMSLVLSQAKKILWAQ